MFIINGKVLDYAQFPDSTPLLHINPELRDQKRVRITWKYENASEMTTLMFINSHLRQALNVYYVWLDMPYIPNARQDRVKGPSDVFTLKYFAQFINSMKFDQVTVFDPHSYVSEALFDNLTVISPKNTINTVLDKVKQEAGFTTIFFPDEGAMKRYAEMIGPPYLFGVKQRDWYTGEIKSLKLEGDLSKVEDKPVLIIDDICSKGGTFYHSAKALKEAGARKIYLYVSHCENTIFSGKLIEGDLIEKIYTTDSIYTGNHKKIEVLQYESNMTTAPYPFRWHKKGI